MSSNFGDRIHISIFGQSHGEAIGVVVDGLPSGERIDMDELLAFLERRAPGRNQYSTKRKEPDKPVFLSGLVDGITCGAPLTAIIENTNQHSKDYAALKDVPRPGHADFPAEVKHHGYQDVRGGGHFSARLTAPLCIAGGICLQLLKRRGITIGAHIASIGTVDDQPFDPVNITPDSLHEIGKKPFPVIDDHAGKQMQDVITKAASELDSVGGTVECCILGSPVGLGEPLFDGLENKIAQAVFAIPAVKGIEFGIGFLAARLKGSENNDAFIWKDGSIQTETNRHGGILGGLASGMPIVFRAAFKPTPSIAQKQRSISFQNREEVPLEIHGRHDPCVVLRATPCVEAAAAIAICDLLL